MKRIEHVNIGGCAFQVDEDAYEKLKVYLENMEKYFSSQEGGKEILFDIETRVAEIFREKLKGLREVISLEDVEYMINQVGNPVDFEMGDRHDNFNKGNAFHYKRMYRDPDNRVLGGVCSGIGAYFQVDPNLVRALFLIAFLGFGIGLIIYLVLWIIIPEATTVGQKLEMKGEPVNFSNIGNFMRDEFRRMKNNKRFK